MVDAQESLGGDSVLMFSDCLASQSDSGGEERLRSAASEAGIVREEKRQE